MGLRKILNEKPILVIAIMVVAVVIVGYLAYRQMPEGASTSGGSEYAYFTSDDGKTLFTGQSTDVPPIQKDGKEAVKAYVFVSDGKEMVGFLERFTPDAKATLERVNAARATGKPLQENAQTLMFVMTSGRQVKKPGDKDWVPGASPLAMRMTRVVDAKGMPAQPKLP
jgi:hypothetical protein